MNHDLFTWVKRMNLVVTYLTYMDWMDSTLTLIMLPLV